MPVLTSRQVHLKQRPRGTPEPSDFELVSVEVPDPGPGEVRVRNQWLSVDPYMRGRMYDRKSYVPPFAIGEPLDGGAVAFEVALYERGQLGGVSRRVVAGYLHEA